MSNRSTKAIELGSSPPDGSTSESSTWSEGWDRSWVGELACTSTSTPCSRVPRRREAQTTGRNAGSASIADLARVEEAVAHGPRRDLRPRGESELGQCADRKS